MNLNLDFITSLSLPFSYEITWISDSYLSNRIFITELILSHSTASFTTKSLLVNIIISITKCYFCIPCHKETIKLILLNLSLKAINFAILSVYNIYWTSNYKFICASQSLKFSMAIFFNHLSLTLVFKEYYCKVKIYR